MQACDAAEREVTVRAENRNDGFVMIAVRDAGPGLAEGQAEKMFQPFYTTKRDGLGMGLAICQSIVKAHGGALWAENNADRGATFCFTLPVATTEWAAR
jgi:two-component system sensor kinase FixL